MHTLADWLSDRPVLPGPGRPPPFDPSALDFGRAPHTALRPRAARRRSDRCLARAYFGAAADSPDRPASSARADRSPGRRQSRSISRRSSAADRERLSSSRGANGWRLRVSGPERSRSRRRSKVSCCRVSTACRRRPAARCRAPPCRLRVRDRAVARRR
jgi:hypothetical protein